MRKSNPLDQFHEPVRAWFAQVFAAPTPAQVQGWTPIVEGRSTLLLAPTGSGKTLAAFLAGLDRLLFEAPPPPLQRCRLLYVSPLKALAVDIERNLRAPLAGIAAASERLSIPYHLPTVGIRTGDTPARERAQMLRHPPDVLITTPESLFLLLTSRAREFLRSVETVIIDEIHSLVATKRGAHLFLSLERLEALRTGPGRKPLQRLGLSATTRPLDEVARLLGGGTLRGEQQRWQQRPVAIIDAGVKKQLELTVEVPVDDLSRIGEMEEPPSGSADAGSRRRSIWPSLHPRLLELVRAHTSTMIFANSRRLAERLAGALNELAGEEVALAHHGSVAREKRQEMEDRLKRGELKCIVATSTLELGIDMGAVELVLQIEAPPSVASGLQRLGRARHQVGGVPRGVIFPKHRGDLLASAAAATGMTEGAVEATAYPRNPLDVLAQQIVAITCEEPIGVERLFSLVRCAAPFAELPRSSFEGVLEMLSGRYPSDEFAELRARITWDRVKGELKARDGAARIAVANAGTIPDRGLYGVFLASGDEVRGGSTRVGELDEEMVFETRAGDVFVLGASSWRVEEITHDKVLVSPAPGQPGKMPFWHGDRPGRPIEFGERIGKLSRELVTDSSSKATRRLQKEHGLDEKAARNLLAYLHEQAEATGAVPSDRTIVVERTYDDVGDIRVCVLTPFGARVHAPWATAVQAQLREGRGIEADILWGDDGMVFRVPDAGAPPAVELFFPAANEVEDLVTQVVGQGSLFAARFRENAGRALLLPRRHPGRRSPLWAQRKKSAELLAVAQRYGSFPLLLETYREVLRDVFDLPGLVALLGRVEARTLKIVSVDSRTPSPFASSLLFSYVASFIYDGDAPLAERRAQALSVDQAQLRELLGEAELRELLDADAIEEFERRAQRLDAEHKPRTVDGVHDLLLLLGDLSEPELQVRLAEGAQIGPLAARLVDERRAVRVQLAGQLRLVATEDIARFRDAVGLVPPPGLPSALLEPVRDPLADLVSRYARTHGPFRAEELAERLGLGVGPVRTALGALAAQDRVLEGEFLPRRLQRGIAGREWVDAEVLRTLKRRSLSRLRQQIEPVEPAALGRFAVEWHGVDHPRRGADALLTAIEQLQGAPLLASSLFTVLGARVQPLQEADLDLLCSAGEVVWRGLGPLGGRDGRLALYLTDHLPLLGPAATPAPGELQAKLRGVLHKQGASFFAELVTAASAFPADVLAALWDLVWAGEVTNDTLAPLRSWLGGAEGGSAKEKRALLAARGFRSRRSGLPGSEGRWALLPPLGDAAGKAGPGPTKRAAALAAALLARHGVLTREAVMAEEVPGGFTAVYGVLKAMEEAGRVRRGLFVAGLGATQFAQPGAEERLRALREPSEESGPALVLAATDPANPYGAGLPWPARPASGPSEPASLAARPQRGAGAQVVLHDGALLAVLARGEQGLTTWLPEGDPARGKALSALVRALANLVDSGRRKALLLARIDGVEAERSPLRDAFVAAGFSSGIKGLLKRAPLEGRFGGGRVPRAPPRGPLGPDLARSPWSRHLAEPAAPPTLEADVTGAEEETDPDLAAEE